MASLAPLLAVLALLAAGCAAADDWPMFGRDPSRNAVSREKNPPTRACLLRGKERNVAWSVPLPRTVAAPVVADGTVWVASKDFRSKDSLLLGFGLDDGLPRGRLALPWRARPGVREEDWQAPQGSPAVAENRIWFITPSWDVVCVDIRREPRLVWSFDLIERLGVTPAHPGMFKGVHCSITLPYRGRIYVSTGHARADLPWNPDAPALVCLDATTGELLARDPPGTAAGTVTGNWSSPVVVDGRVFFGGGDGHLYAFDPGLRPLWKVDAAAGLEKRVGLSTPVVHEGRAYAALGGGDADGSAPGTLTCVDVRSGTLVWRRTDVETSIGTPVVHRGVVYMADMLGVLHAIDAVTGVPRWRYDTLTTLDTSPLVVGEILYLVTTDGEMLVLDLHDDQFPLLGKIDSSDALGTPIYSRGTLLVAGDRLYAIRDLGQDIPASPGKDKVSRGPRPLFVPTPNDVVEKMLDLAKVGPEDLVVDLGSGDGRIPIAARARGSRARGVEIDPELVKASRERAPLIDWIQGDLFEADLSDATVVTLYLGTANNVRLLPKLRALKPGTRIVSYVYDFGPDGPAPDRTVGALHLWTTPLK